VAGEAARRDTLTLDDGRARVVVAPAAGAALVRYDWRPHGTVGARVPLLRPGPDIPDPADPFALGCNLLLPWSNRISGGGFRFGGRFHRLVPNLPGEACPIHGDAFQRAWRVDSLDAKSVTLSLPAADGPGPLRYGARVLYRLDAGALEIAPELTSLAMTPLPYGLGVHPWFPRTPGTALQLVAEEVRLEDARYLPAGRARVESVPAWNFRHGAALPAGWINNAFTGWCGVASLEWPLSELIARSGEVGGDRADAKSGQTVVPGAAETAAMTGGGRVRLTIRADELLSTCIVHSPGAESSFVCVEPVSHPVDAHNDRDVPLEGLRVLTPGERLAARCRFEPSLRR